MLAEWCKLFSSSEEQSAHRGVWHYWDSLSEVSRAPHTPPQVLEFNPTHRLASVRGSVRLPGVCDLYRGRLFFRTTCSFCRCLGHPAPGPPFSEHIVHTRQSPVSESHGERGLQGRPMSWGRPGSQQFHDGIKCAPQHLIMVAMRKFQPQVWTTVGQRWGWGGGKRFKMATPTTSSEVPPATLGSKELICGCLSPAPTLLFLQTQLRLSRPFWRCSSQA